MLFFRYLEGLLLVVSEASSHNGLVVALRSGHIRMVYNNIWLHTAISEETYNDGEMHSFQVTFANGWLNFVIDGKEQPRIVVFSKWIHLLKIVM